MNVIDANGSQLTANLFIKAYREARKLAPARFMTLRLHPDTLKSIEVLAEPEESIQLGTTLAPLGRTSLRVACVKPLSGIPDGIVLLSDPKMDNTQLEFQIHGNAELTVVNIKP